MRNAPELVSHFERLLQDILDDLSERETTHYLCSFHRLTTTVEQIIVSEGSEASSTPSPCEERPHAEDTGELILAIRESIDSLFKASSIARRAVIRDRYAVALQRVEATQVLSEELDADSVADLFKLLRYPERSWLKLRMAKANNTRRRFIKYREMHQLNISEARLEETVAQPVDREEVTDSDDSRSHTGQTIASSSFVKSTASTAIQAKADIASFETDGTESEASFFSYGTDTGQAVKYKVIDLADVNGGHEEFVCPYCRNEVSCKTQRKWAKHVFADLRAYTCTFIGCDMRMFEDSRAWLTHQMEEHFTSLACPYCQSVLFDTDVLFEQHLRAEHQHQFKDEQLGRLLLLSRQQLDTIPVSLCLFCDWEAKMRNHDKDLKSATPERYRRHMKSHLEEIALVTTSGKEAVDDSGGSDLDSSHDINSCLDARSLHSHLSTAEEMAAVEDGRQPRRSFGITIPSNAVDGSLPDISVRTTSGQSQPLSGLAGRPISDELMQPENAYGDTYVGHASLELLGVARATEDAADDLTRFDEYLPRPSVEIARAIRHLAGISAGLRKIAEAGDSRSRIANVQMQKELDFVRRSSDFILELYVRLQESPTQERLNELIDFFKRGEGSAVEPELANISENVRSMLLYVSNEGLDKKVAGAATAYQSRKAVEQRDPRGRARGTLGTRLLEVINI